MSTANTIGLELAGPLRTLSRCLVCGFAEVRTDEVVDRGLVFLHECPHCEHRWTSRVASAGGSAEGDATACSLRTVREEPLAA